MSVIERTYMQTEEPPNDRTEEVACLKAEIVRLTAECDFLRLYWTIPENRTVTFCIDTVKTPQEDLIEQLKRNGKPASELTNDERECLLRVGWENRLYKDETGKWREDTFVFGTGEIYRIKEEYRPEEKPINTTDWWYKTWKPKIEELSKPE